MKRAINQLLGFGMLLSVLPAQGAVVSVAYIYDDLGRLIKVDYGAVGILNYVYDKAGNITLASSTLNTTVSASVQPVQSFAKVSNASGTVTLSWTPEDNVSADQAENIPSPILQAKAHFKALLADVSDQHEGKELNMPVATDIDGGIRFGFNVFSPDSTATVNGTLRHTTQRSDLLKPVCAAGVQGQAESERWGFLNYAQYLAAGVSYQLQCEAGEWLSQSYVYIVDASSANQTPMLLHYPDKQLVGFNLTEDHNQTGSDKDLMLSLMNDSNGQLSVHLRDFVTGEQYGVTTVTSKVKVAP